MPKTSSEDVLLAITQHGHLNYTEWAVESARRSGFCGHIEVFDDCTPGLDLSWCPKGVAHVHTGHQQKGLTWLWNRAVQYWNEKTSVKHLIISNNDVIFTTEFWDPLMQCFEREEYCGISGPMTNQPGHQQHQLVPIQDPLTFIRDTKTRAANGQKTGNAYQLKYVNGFCFMLRKDRLFPFDDENLFDPRVIAHGNEDEYQERMRNEGYLAFAMDDSRVFHFKDVSYETGRFKDLPRLAEKAEV